MAFCDALSAYANVYVCIVKIKAGILQKALFFSIIVSYIDFQNLQNLNLDSCF